jgi:hypothetical protein
MSSPALPSQRQLLWQQTTTSLQSGGHQAAISGYFQPSTAQRHSMPCRARIAALVQVNRASEASRRTEQTRVEADSCP